MKSGRNQMLSHELDALLKRWERRRIASFWIGLNLLAGVFALAILVAQ
ncbi:hypothetical protein IIDPJIOB_04224 [Aeromonas veronii]|nr:hypothetical protein [Aeromonas veronii]